MTKAQSPEDIHRLVQEVLSRLGYTADADAIAQRVRRLNDGLPAEDEFSVICSWLGKCRLVHKLDQQQTPIASRKDYQVADLIVTFDGAGAFLVEVKRCNDRTLSFKPDYYRRLCAYAELLGKPLLVAWKFLNVWALIDIRSLKKAKNNFNISHNEAMRQNLMGVLAGDVAYTLMPGAGIHFELRKENMVRSDETEEGRTELWNMRVSEVFFTDGNNNRRTDLHSETQQLFTTWPLESHEDHSDSKIMKSFVVEEGQIQFAHSALVQLLAWERKEGEDFRWRRLLGASQITRHISDFCAALDKGLFEGIVQYVFHQQPISRPDFLEYGDSTHTLNAS